MSAHHDSELLSEKGIFLQPYGLPDLPRTSEINKIKKVLEAGIRMPSGNVVSHDADMVEALASPWLEPDLITAQLRSPRFKPTRAGMVATVSGLAASPLLQVNIFNPRPLMKAAIPESDAEGRVALPWAPTDRRADPANATRMIYSVDGRDELNARVLESERLILGDQTALSDLVAREGIQEDLLGIVVNYQTPGLTRRLGVTTVDGNSRLASAREEFRKWINVERDSILDVTRSRRPRQGLERVLNLLKDGLFPLEQDDTVALRHLHRAIALLVERMTTEQLVDTGLFAIPNLFVAPMTMIVAFEPRDEYSTVVDAADSLMRNLHHRTRASKPWDRSAGYVELRDEVVAKLFDAEELSEGEALLVGPKYEEAANRFDQPSEPDRRAMAVICLVNGNTDRARKARQILAAATGDPRIGRRERAYLVVAALSEQVASSNARLRSDFETAVQDVLDTPRYGSVKNMTIDSDFEPEDIVAEAKYELEKGTSVENSDWLIELGLKGAIALAALGHLRRPYGEVTADSPRPYQVIDNMLADELGIDILGDAIRAWRDGSRLPEYDPETRTPTGGGVLRSDTLSLMFGGELGAAPEPTARDRLSEMKSILDRKLVPVFDALAALPEVAREGVPPDLAEEVIRPLDKVRRRLELFAERYTEFYGDPNSGFDDEGEEAARAHD